MFWKSLQPAVRSTATAVLCAASFTVGLASSASAQICAPQGCDFCLDCDSNVDVSLGDVQKIFLIFLGATDSSTCPIIDGLETNLILGDAQKGFNQFLNGCAEESERIEQSIPQYGVVGFGPLHVERGSPPAGGAGGPTLVVPPAATVPAGATVGPVPLTSEQPFTTLVLTVPGSDGFYRAELEEPTTEVAVQITFGNQPPRSNFDCLFSAGDAGGAVGPAGVTAITISSTPGP